MKKWLILFALISGVSLPAQPAVEPFQQGNTAYRQDSFPRAIDLYNSALAKGYESAALYYNLGNAHFKTGNLAPAILNYHRALQLKPGDEEIQHNLKIAEQKTVDRFEELPRPLMQAAYLAVVTLFSPDTWARLALAFLGLLLLGIVLYLYTPFGRLGFTGAATGLLLGLLSLSLAYAHQSHQKHHRAAIIMSPSTYVKSGPSADAEDSFILHEGTKAAVIERYEGWHKIRIPDGKLGWVPESDIEMI